MPLTKTNSSYIVGNPVAIVTPEGATGVAIAPAVSVVNTDGTSPPVDSAGAAKPATLTPKGYQQIVTVDNTTVWQLTVPGGSRYAVIRVSAQAIRWRDDGVNPTTTVGMSQAVGSELAYDGSLSAFRLIAVVAGAIIDIAYYA
jgi:hypothetical protein